MTMGGVMNYVALDIGNLKRWFAGTIGTTGNLALNNNGYIVYFSDRRGNHDVDAVGRSGDRRVRQRGLDQLGGRRRHRRHRTAVLEGGEDRNEDDGLQILRGHACRAPWRALPGGAPGR